MQNHNSWKHITGLYPAVELLSFFLFHVSYSCLFCLLVLHYYVVNKDEYIYKVINNNYLQGGK